MSAAILNAPDWSPLRMRRRPDEIPAHHTPRVWSAGRPLGGYCLALLELADGLRGAPLECEHLAKREMGVAQADQTGGRSRRRALPDGL